MQSERTGLRKVGENMGMLMFLGGVLVIGVGGFLLLCTVAYAMVTGNLALGVVAGMFLFAPLVFGVAWLLTGGVSLLGERSASKASDFSSTLSPAVGGQADAVSGAPTGS